MPGTRCGGRSDASKTQPGGPSNRCQAPGAAPGRMLANRSPNRCLARMVLYPGRSHLSPDGGGLTRAAVHRLAADGYDLAADGYRSGVAT